MYGQCFVQTNDYNHKRQITLKYMFKKNLAYFSACEKLFVLSTGLKSFV